jgi:hypothetical protein
MAHTWYVTFEVQKTGVLPKGRSPRLTKTFGTETEAKNFAREKFNEGLAVYAGTINPHVPKQLISSSGIPRWLGAAEEINTANPEGAKNKEK